MKHQELTAEQIRKFKPEVFRELYKTMSGRKIAEHLGVGFYLVRNRLKMWGIKKQPSNSL